MHELVLSPEHISSIIAHCRSAYPDEACGMLAGKEYTVEKVYKITNIEPSPVSYLMDPKEQFNIMKEMRLDNNRMIAIYHSHPSSPPYPSDKDIRLAFYSDAIYIIVGLTDMERPEIRAYEIADGLPKEIVIKRPVLS